MCILVIIISYDQEIHRERNIIHKGHLFILILQEVRPHRCAKLQIASYLRGAYGTHKNKQISDNARQFAQTHLFPRVLEDYREEKF